MFTPVRGDAEPPAIADSERATGRGRRAAGWLLLSLTLWLLAAGRWGSYFGLPDHQIYVTEIVLAVVAALLLADGGLRSLRQARLPKRYVVPAVALLGWASLRTLHGLSADIVVLRDYAPYAYIVVAAMVVAAAQPRRVRFALLAATLFHAAWVTPLLWNSRFYAAVEYPLGRTRYFELRTDFDALAAGVLGCACILVATRHLHLGERVLFVGLGAWSGAIVMLINNRAGLLATLVAAVWAGLNVLSRHSQRLGIGGARRRQLVVGGSIAAVAAMAAILVVTPAGQRLTETFDLEGSQMENRTASARVTVYGKVVRYVAESPTRLVVGVGMGPDFLAAADATGDYDPGETLGVRAPHNFLIGTFARLGLVGASLHLLLVLLGYLLAWRVARTGTRDTLTQLAALLVVAIPVAAAVGVVLESPFGAVPYIWGYSSLVILYGRLRGGRASETEASTRELVG